MSIEEILNHVGVEGLNTATPQVAQTNGQQLVPPPIQTNEQGIPLFQARMLQTIEEVDQYSWSRGELGGLDWGFQALNEALEGLNTGVHLIGGPSNVGKSAFCSQLAWQIITNNRDVNEKRKKKAFVLYFTLDDNINELLPRLIAIDQQIPINAVRFPFKYKDNKEYMERREKGFERLKEMTMNFAMLDSNSGSDIEYIEETVEWYANELAMISPHYQIVPIIDNFHDITTRNHINNENERYNYIADKLTKLATKFDAPIICTAELRKLNGMKRPKADDVRETVKIQYEAKSIMLCYNEVSLREQQAQVFWQKPGVPDKQPVFEIHIAKNKFGSYKGRIFFEFVPEMSFFREVPRAGAQKYAQMIAS